MLCGHMKQLHAARHAPEAHLIKGFLESNGIAAVVRGEFLTGGWGELPVDVCSVWVSDDAQYDRAHALLVTFLNGDFAREFRGQHWRCQKCGEQIEGQFTSCWNCNTARPA
jgi:Putative prokaryotic signal transducing protein